jgi:hypothetical protein
MVERISPSEDGEALPKDINSTNSTYPDTRETNQTKMHFYAADIVCGHEERMARYLEQAKVECILPHHRMQHQLKDRSKILLDLRPFSECTFDRISSDDCVKVLDLQGVLSLVSVWNFRPAALPQLEIEMLPSGLAQPRSEPHPVAIAGQGMRIRVKPSSGMEEVVARKKNSFDFALTLDLLMLSSEVKVRGEDPEPVYPTCSLTLNIPLRTDNRPSQISTGEFNCLDSYPDSLQSLDPSPRSVGRIEGSASENYIASPCASLCESAT